MPRQRGSPEGRPEASSNLLQVELLQEKAANLGRLARRLERALVALGEHDAAAVGETAPGTLAASAAVEATALPAPAQNPAVQSRRRELLADAGEALFLYVVQREVLGLRGTPQALDELGVPREVRLCMAPRSVLLAR